MTIKIKDLMKDLNLSEDQATKLAEVQNKLDTTIHSEIETAKTGLVNKNQELIDKLKDAKNNAIPDGFDMEGYQDYVKNAAQIQADKQKAEEDALIASKNWDKLKNDMANSHELAMNEVKNNFSEEYNHLKNAFDSELIENVTLKEIDSVKGSQILLMPHIKNAVKTYQDESGKFLTKVVDSEGNDRINNETGNPFSVKELVAEFQANEAFAGAFPIANNGSQTVVNAGGTQYNSTNNPFDKSSKSYSITEQAKITKNNPTLAKSLKSAVS